MKIILKISMICGLLLSVFGTVQAARKYAPGVAMRMATTGDFDVAESEQILADIPEEWKKEHRAIVRQIENGTRGRGVVIKKTVEIDPEKEDIDELADKPTGKTSTKEEWDERTEVVVVDMKDALTSLMQALYEEKNGSYVLNKFNYNEVNKYLINPKKYADYYSDLIPKLNDFIKFVIRFEEANQLGDGSSKVLLPTVLDKASAVSGVALKLGGDTPQAQPACLAIVNALKTWYKKRLTIALEQPIDNNFINTLDERIKALAEGTGVKGKQNSSKILEEMSYILADLISKYYEEKKSGFMGFGSKYFDLKETWKRYGLEKIALNNDNKDDAKLIESFNEFISAVRTFESTVSAKKKAEQKDYTLLLKSCSDFVTLLKGLCKEQANVEFCSKIVAQLKNWYTLRILNGLSRPQNDEFYNLLGSDVFGK